MAVGLGWFLATGGDGWAAEPSVGAVRDRLTQWVQTRQLLSRTRVDWERDCELLEQTRALHERELRTIEERFGGLSTNTTQVDRDLAVTREELAASEAALAVVRERVGEYEGRLRRWIPRLPPPLRQQADPLLRRLPGDEAAAARATPLERLQTVVGLLNEIDKFNGTVAIVSEIQKSPAGGEIQVETIYLGLAQAWFVDRSGDYAGTGVPGPDGWEWTPDPALAERIRRAIDMYREAAPPAFVALPVTLR